MQSEQCPFCPPSSFRQIIQEALSQRYPSAHYLMELNELQSILQDGICEINVHFKQNNYVADQEEYLRREYAVEEFPNKIELLTERQKFHRNVPMLFDRGITSILGKHYDRLRDYDYKRVKIALKLEQQISITTLKSESSFFNSSFIQKSRYSTVLGPLNQSHSDSHALLEICEKIDSALPFVKPHIRGSYNSGEKKFREFLKQEKKRELRNGKLSQRNQKIYNPQGVQYRLKRGVYLQNGLKKMVKRPPRTPNKLSIQKSTANQTISREEKNKKSESFKWVQRQNTHPAPPLRKSLSRMKSHLFPEKKTIEEIYQPSTYSSHHPKQESTHNLHRKLKQKLNTQKLGDYFSEEIPHQRHRQPLHTGRDHPHRSKSHGRKSAQKKSSQPSSHLKRSQSLPKGPLLRSRSRSSSTSGLGHKKQQQPRSKSVTQKNHRLSSHGGTEQKNGTSVHKRKTEKFDMDKILEKKLRVGK